MVMTTEPKYAEVLKGMGELLAIKDVTRTCNELTIDDLEKQLADTRKKLAAAEKQLNGGAA